MIGVKGTQNWITLLAVAAYSESTEWNYSAYSYCEILYKMLQRSIAVLCTLGEIIEMMSVMLCGLPCLFLLKICINITHFTVSETRWPHYESWQLSAIPDTVNLLIRIWMTSSSNIGHWGSPYALQSNVWVMACNKQRLLLPCLFPIYQTLIISTPLNASQISSPCIFEPKVYVSWLWFLSILTNTSLQFSDV
jgi:hypothetical protein